MKDGKGVFGHKMGNVYLGNHVKTRQILFVNPYGTQNHLHKFTFHLTYYTGKMVLCRVPYIMGISVVETKSVYGYILKDGKGVFGNGVFEYTQAKWFYAWDEENMVICPCI